MLNRSSRRIDVTGVDHDGVRVKTATDRVLDVTLDGRRVWSFWSLRDTLPEGRDERSITWPGALAGFLDGHTRLSVTDHVSGRELFAQELRFGESEERIAVVNKAGAPVGLDKSGRMSATFDTRSRADVDSLMTAIGTVLELVSDAGVEAFLAYGTLLGAIREGALLGHDSDADLAYVSHHRHPVDVVRESFRLQRRINERGFSTYRYSGAAFRVDVAEGDGVVRGLDVFAGFFDEDRLYLMGEIGADFQRDWIYPLGAALLEGVSFPVPAVPERLLEATYGPSWRVPDPAFRFETDEHTQQRLNGWFRGTAPRRTAWERRYSGQRQLTPRLGPSIMARRLSEEVGEAARVIDVGAGRGADGLWLAKKGLQVVAYDFVPSASMAVQRSARRRNLSLEARHLNLTELRSVLLEGARVSRGPRTQAMLARHVYDATTPLGRDMLLRFASLSLRGGGSLYLEVWTGEGQNLERLEPVALDQVERAIIRRGGEVTSREDIPYRAEGQGKQYSIGRLVAKWA